MLKSRKHVFWEALIITIVIFLAGLFLGMLVETGNSEKISQLYLESEINLVDGLAVTFLADEYDIDCEILASENIDFANRVYEEAKLLEKFEEKGQLTNTMEVLHKKYDLLRSLLWMSNENFLKECENYDLLIYLYMYQTEDTGIKATQNVWSKLLSDIQEERENLVLLPIAADQNLTSVKLLIEEHNVSNLPAVVVNNEEIIYDLESLTELKSGIK